MGREVVKKKKKSLTTSKAILPGTYLYVICMWLLSFLSYPTIPTYKHRWVWLFKSGDDGESEHFLWKCVLF